MTKQPIIPHIFTVGNEKNYDQGLLEYGERWLKLGRTDTYSGGYAFKTAEDAARLIEEQDMRGEWAIYAVEADWEKDTAPSEHGWWHALLKTSRVLCKVEIPTAPATKLVPVVCRAVDAGITLYGSAYPTCAWEPSHVEFVTEEQANEIEKRGRIHFPNADLYYLWLSGLQRLPTVRYQTHTETITTCSTDTQPQP